MTIIKEVDVFCDWLRYCFGPRGEELVKIVHAPRLGMPEALVHLSEQECADWMWWRGVFQDLEMEADDMWVDDPIIKRLRVYEQFSAGYLATGRPRFPYEEPEPPPDLPDVPDLDNK
jgi:hypothetical protein